MAEVADRLELGQRSLSPTLLHEAPENPRTITGERFDALKRSIEKDPSMMEARPVIATPDGSVVAGNMRLRAAKELGIESIPVYVADLSPKQKREWMLRDNQPYGEYVDDQLAELIKLHEEEEGDMDMLGFTQEDVSHLLKSLEGAPVMPDAEEQEDPVMKSEVLVEVYCTKEALTELSPTLEEWSELDGVEVSISG